MLKCHTMEKHKLIWDLRTTGANVEIPPIIYFYILLMWETKLLTVPEFYILV